MIELTKLNGDAIVLNADLIEFMEFIPETKIALTNGKYYLVMEEKDEVIQKIVEYRQRVYSGALVRLDAPRPQGAASPNHGKRKS